MTTNSNCFSWTARVVAEHSYRPG